MKSQLNRIGTSVSVKRQEIVTAKLKISLDARLPFLKVITQP